MRAICRRCNRIVPPDDHVAFNGFAYHSKCLPRRALIDEETGEAIPKRTPTIEKKPVALKIYEALERRAVDGKIGNLEMVLNEIAIEMNTNTGWVEHYVRQLDSVGSVHRLFNTLELRHPPSVSSSG